MGGEIVLQAALTAPEKIIGVIAVDNFKIFVSKYSEKDKEDIDGFMQALKTTFDTTAAMYTAAALFPPGSGDSASINRVIKSVQQSDSVVAIKSLESLMQFALQDSALISRLHIPIHLIVSDYTATNEKSILQAGKPGSGVTTIMGTGHYPMIEKPEEFTYLLQQTIYRIGKTK
jgi:pimeloyl-ACP methyl ester carboxylesterase